MGKIIYNNQSYAGMINSAGAVMYDGTASGLEATNLQDAVDQVSGALNGMRFGVNENGEYGYYVTDSAGADTFIPFRGDSNRTYYYKKGKFAEGVEVVGASATYAKFTLNEDHVHITTSGASTTGIVSFTNIDVTDINYLYFDIHYPTPSRMGISVDGAQTMYWEGNIFDVTEYTGVHSFGFYSAAGAKIYNIFGTKEIEAPTWIDRTIEQGTLKLTEVLWENPDPTASFASQSISLPTLPEYDYVMIEAYYNNSNQVSNFEPALFPTCKINDGTTATANYASTGVIHAALNEGEFPIASRTVYVNYSDVYFHAQGSYNTAADKYTYNNNYCIPYRIYGVREVDIENEERVLEDIAYVCQATATPIIHVEDYTSIELYNNTGSKPSSVELYGVTDPNDPLINDYYLPNWVSGAVKIGSVAKGSTATFDISPYAYIRMHADGTAVRGTYTLTGKRLSENSFSDNYEFTNIAGSVGTRSLTIDSVADHVYIVHSYTGFITDVSQITPTNCDILGFNSIGSGSNFYEDVFIVKATGNSFTLTINSESGYFKNTYYTDLVS